MARSGRPVGEARRVVVARARTLLVSTRLVQLHTLASLVQASLVVQASLTSLVQASLDARLVRRLHLPECRRVRHWVRVHLQVLHGRAVVQHQLRRHVVQPWCLETRVVG